MARAVGGGGGVVLPRVEGRGPIEAARTRGRTFWPPDAFPRLKGRGPVESGVVAFEEEGGGGSFDGCGAVAPLRLASARTNIHGRSRRASRGKPGYVARHAGPG